jgi:hypothetical protein
MKTLVPDLPSVIAMLGFSALIYGIWQVHRPSAWIAAGFILITYSVLATAAKKREAR